MSARAAEISEQYNASLHSYLNGEGESALRAAYELGRRSIAEELSSVALVAIHQDALLAMLEGVSTIEDSSDMVRASWQFLLESLSPFEMTIRGYREALRTLQGSEERYRTLIDTARDVIYSLSPAGVIKTLNPVFEDITGFARSEWLERSFVRLVHPDDVPFIRSLSERVRRGETPPPFEIRVRSKSGTYVTGEFATTPQYTNGELTGMFGIARDVTEQRGAQEQMRSLAKRVVNAQEDERRRIARELHDDLCQWLSGVKLSLNLLEEKIPSARTLRKKLRTLKEQVNHKIVDVRRLSVSLRPSALDDFGLVVALSRLTEDCARLYKIPISFHTEGQVVEYYHDDVETALYRITQEGLSNLQKHSRARRGNVRLSHVEHNLTLDIEDDGVGFDEAALQQHQAPGEHLGLVSMKERATLLGGILRIVSEPDKGTKIHVEIPLELDYR